MLARLRSLLAAVFRRDHIEDDMDAEIRFHVEQQVEDLVRRGVPRDEAERQARATFGRLDGVKDACRQARALDAVDAVRRDVRYACRLLARSPGFSLTVIATLALCIGANTAIFSVVDAVLFRPLPYPQPEKLLQVVTYITDRQLGAEYWMTSQNGATWEMLRDRASALDWATFAGSARVNLAAGQNVEYVEQQRVSAGFFRVLGVPPAIGREFSRDEDRPGGARVVVISHALWQRLFGGAWPIARPLLLRGEPYSVIGVAAPGFASGVRADLWTPLRPTRFNEGAGENYTIVGRLKPGTSWPAASANVAAIGRAVSADLKTRNVTGRLALVGMQRAMTGIVRRPLLILLAGVIVVLLIGCLNLAGLLVARGLDRTPEIATRIALGCGRPGVLRQLVVESLLLALLGAAAALAVARLAIGWLAHVAVETYGLWQPIGLDGRVLAATALLALATTLMFGLAPALQAMRVDVRAGLTSAGGRAIARGVTRWPRRLLVVGQIALGVVLLTDAGLLLRSFAHLTASRGGIDTTNVLAATLPLQDVRYAAKPSVTNLYDRSLERIRELPGIDSAAVALTLPYERGLNLAFRRASSQQNAMMLLNYVTPGFFSTLRLHVRRGRTFTDRDTADAAGVVVLDQSFVKRYFKDRDPLLEQLRFGGPGRGNVWTVVGVVDDVPHRASLAGFEPVDTLPTAYIPASQMPVGFSIVHIWFSPSWVVRTTSPQPGLARSLERVMASIDPQMPFASFKRIEDLQSETLAPERFEAVLLTAFSTLAILLAAIGLYGLVAKSVAERTHELGIRMALGSTVARAMRTIAAPVVALAAVGVGTGVLLAAWSVRLIESEIWGVRPNDAASMGGSALGLLLLTVVVSFAATARIARMSPSETLRRE